MIGIVCNSFYRPFLWILLQGGHPEKHSIMMILIIAFNIIGNIILIPIIGIYGAVISAAFVYIIEALMIKYFSKKLLVIKL